MKSLAAAAYAIMLTFLSTPAFTAETPFDQAQFDTLRAAGKPVAVVFHADWCPTCRAQAPVLKELTQTAQLKPLTLFVANFDTEKGLKRALGVTQQSTVVVFKARRAIRKPTGSPRCWIEPSRTRP